MASTPHRATYLLSVWREGEGEPWRAALQPADGGPRAGFGDLEQLAAFLLRLQDELAPAAADEAEAREGGRRREQSKWSGQPGTNE